MIIENYNETEAKEKAEYKPLEAGVYLLRIESQEELMSSGGKRGLKFNMVVASGPNAGAKVSTTVWIDGKIRDLHLYKMNKCFNANFLSDSSVFIGKVGNVEITIKEYDKEDGTVGKAIDINPFTGFIESGATPPPVATPVQTPATPAPASLGAGATSAPIVAPTTATTAEEQVPF